MKVVRVFLLLIILVILYVGLLVAQVGLGARVVLINPDYYTAVLRNHHFYEALPGAVLAGLDAELGGMPSSERANVEKALREALSPDWVEAQVSGVLRDVSSYLRGKTPALTALIPLGQVQERLLDSYSKIGNPYVTAELRQHLDFRNIPLGEHVPEGLTVAAAPYIQLAAIVPPIVCGLWLVLALLCFPLAGGVPGGAKWIGTAFLLSGLTAFVGSFVIRVISSGFLADLSFAGDAGPLALLPVREVATAVAHGALAVMRNHGLMFIGIAILLYVGAALTGRARARRPAARESAAPAVTAPAETKQAREAAKPRSGKGGDPTPPE
jgi:hypothetical protein